jgi:hypothetical protein
MRVHPALAAPRRRCAAGSCTFARMITAVAPSGQQNQIGTQSGRMMRRCAVKAFEAAFAGTTCQAPSRLPEEQGDRAHREMRAGASLAAAPQQRARFSHARRLARVSRNRRPLTAQGAGGTSASPAGAVRLSGFPGPAIAQRDPSRTPCRSHCALPRQGGGIRPRAAGIHLQSRLAPLPTRPNSPLSGRSLSRNCSKTKTREWLKFSRGQPY